MVALVFVSGAILVTGISVWKRESVISQIESLRGFVYYKTEVLPEFVADSKFGFQVFRPFIPLKGISFSYSKINDQDLKLLRSLSVERLDLSMSNVTDAGIAHLKEMSYLESLDLTDTRVTGACLAELQGIDSLKQLSFNNSEISSQGYLHISNLRLLEYLKIGTSNMKDLQTLQNLPLLNTLSIDRYISDEAVAKIKIWFPNCRTFYLRDDPDNPFDSLKMLE